MIEFLKIQYLAKIPVKDEQLYEKCLHRNSYLFTIQIKQHVRISIIYRTIRG